MKDRSIQYVAAAAAVVAALAAGFALTRGAPMLPLDDAYIHLVFAENLAQGHGFSFNPPEPSLGFSSPLWVATLAAASLLGADLEQAARLFSIGSFAAAVLFVFLITMASLKRAGAQTPWPEILALLAALGVALSGNMLWLAGAGMETTLFLAFCLAAILLILGEKQRPWPAGAALALALLTRPTALSLAAVLALAALLDRERKKGLVKALALALGVFAAWAAFSYFTTGFALPPTRAGKLASDLMNAGPSPSAVLAFVYRHLVYLWLFERGAAWLLLFDLAAAIAALALTSRKNQTRPAIAPAAALAAFALAHLVMHAVFFRSTQIITPYHNLRYQPMLIPALWSAGACLFWRVGSRLDKTGFPVWRIAGVAALLAVLSIEGFSMSRWRAYFFHNSSHLVHVHRAAALWSSRFLPADARVATLDIGVMGYLSERYVIDLGGLIDPAAIPYLAQHRTGPYLKEKGATHYAAMVRHDSERITGVKKDDGRLYNLIPLRSFSYPYYERPVFIHSLGLNLYSVNPP